MLIHRQKKTKTFDVTYLICNEQLVFPKMATLCELEKHGVDLEPGYKMKKPVKYL